VTFTKMDFFLECHSLDRMA